MNRKSILKGIVLLMLLAVLCMQCSCLVDRLALYPTRDNVQINLSGAKEIVVHTKDQKEIGCLYLDCPGSSQIALYFHGNAENIYQSLPILERINQCGINVLGVDFRGYGKSTGRASERGIYLDGLAALDYVKNTLDYSDRNIIVIGTSIGTVVACKITENTNIPKLLLICPISNGFDYGKAHGFGFFSRLAKNKYDNLKKLKGIQAEMMIFAAEQDVILPVWMSEKIAKQYKGKVELKIIKNAGHNTILAGANVFDSICEFINK